MTVAHYIGAAFVLLLVTSVGVLSGRGVRSAADFNAGGRKAGAGVVMGAIVGTLVGGSSTVGTAQLAFNYGISACWFTLGGGIGCLILAVFFARPFYESGIDTMPQLFAREYGTASSTAVTLLTSLGSFFSIVSQFLSGIVLITSVSAIPPRAAAALIVGLTVSYVAFGGVWGAGYVGMVKTALLCTAAGICGVLAVRLQGGAGVFRALLDEELYFNLFARGLSTDLGAGVSLVLGLLTTQSYIQAMISAKTLAASRAGVAASASVIPLVGVGGIFVGMYMKLNRPDIIPAFALPAFIIERTPPFLGGMFLATLLITVVGTAGGVALGLGSMFCNDIYCVYVERGADEKRRLPVSRGVILLVLSAAAVFSSGNLGSTILDWSFLSMGLRGAVAFGPLCCALFLPNKIPARFALASMIAGPLLVAAAKFFLPSAVDPLFLGMTGNLSILAAGMAYKRRTPSPRT
jgi:SSS family solute:Na+ symporter